MEDDGDDKEESKRITRNLSEKKRRDQFNSLVTELSNLISNNNRKMDKSTVLRSTISFLKNHNEVTVRSRAHDVQEDWKPAFLSNEEFTYLVLEALEGFVMVFSTSGRIFYASESITSLLGHDPTEIVDQNIFEMMHGDDQQNLYNILQRNAATEHIENQSKENEMITFQIHIRRGCLDFREEVSYDVVQFYGHFRQNQEQDIEGDVMDFRDAELSSNVIFVCIGCLRTPKLIRDVSLVDSTRSEFTSRHSLEWKFLFLDHRAPPIIGYLPFEVLGTSGYDYYHFDDLEKVISCHEALMQKGELTSGYYRFLTKGQQWIWLQTRFYITYHQWNSKPEFVVCTHRVVSYAEVIRTKEELVEQDTELTESEHVVSMKEMPVKEPLPTLSPPYNVSEGRTDAYINAYQSTSQPTSVKSTPGSRKCGTIAQAAVPGATWSSAQAQYTDASAESRSSRTSDQETQNQPLPTKQESLITPQHDVAAHYVEPMYVTGAVPPGLLTLAGSPPLQDQTQIQEQLHRKHEELQKMIVRQQEELRQVKEQLLLARLGILQPLINVPSNTFSTTQEEMQNQEAAFSAQGPVIPAQPPPQPDQDHQHMPQ